MNVWVQVVRVNGRTYRIGDVTGVYELADGEDPPDLSNLKGKDGRVPFASLGITNWPAKFEELDQVKRLFQEPWEDEPANPEDEREAPPDNAERDEQGNIIRPAFMPRRKFIIDPNNLPPPRRRALFEDPPYTLTLTWAQLRSGMRQHKEDRPVTDNDIPDKRVRAARAPR